MFEPLGVEALVGMDPNQRGVLSPIPARRLVGGGGRPYYGTLSSGSCNTPSPWSSEQVPPDLPGPARNPSRRFSHLLGYYVGRTALVRRFSRPSKVPVEWQGVLQFLKSEGL